MNNIIETIIDLNYVSYFEGPSHIFIISQVCFISIWLP